MNTFLKLLILLMFINATPGIAVAAPASAKKVKKFGDKVTANINGRCAAKWGDNYRMQKYCRKRQREGYNWVGRHINSNGWSKKANQKGKRFMILVKCWGKWSDKWKQNWPMVKYCVERQESALRSL
jgi:hypothetical protein